MSEHLTNEQIDNFRERRLSPVELFAVGQHLGGCAACRAQIENARSFIGAASLLQADLKLAAEKPEHLSYEQLSAFVDGDLSEIDREIVSSHLQICQSCAREEKDLREFAASLVPQTATIAAETENKISVWEKIRNFGLFGSPSVAFGAASILLVLGLAAFWLLTNRSFDRNDIAENQPTPTATVSATISLATPSPFNSPTPETPDSNSDAPVQNEQKTLIQENEAPAEKPESKPETKPETKHKLIAPEESAPLLALNDNGRQIALGENGKITGFSKLSADETKLVRQALSEQKIETSPDLQKLFAKDGTLMNGNNQDNKNFAVNSPAGVIVNETRPVLRWNKMEGASEYRVSIYDESYREIGASENLKQTEWQISQPLKRGAVYSWEVAAIKDGKTIATAPAPPASEARFKILEQKKSVELSRSIAKNPRSALWKGLAYARAGLLAEAEQEFEILVKQNPNSQQAKKLLEQIRKLKGN